MMDHIDFVHLHNHTQYSLLDGALKIENLIDTAISLKMPAIAITDHGNMFGVIKFYQKCMAKGIKPIVGCEVYVAPGSRFDKSPRKGEGQNYYHLILLAKDSKGYHNLLKLVSAGYTEGFYYKPRIDKEILSRHSEGLIGLSACLHGEIPSLLLSGQTEEAEKTIGFFNDVFGKGDFYIELMDNAIERQKEANRLLIETARKLSVPIVATNDCHYLKREDVRAHEMLLCIGTKSTMNDEKRFRFQTGEFYFKTPHEMREAFRGYEEALHNTVEIAEKCNLQLGFGKTLLPMYVPPEGMDLKQYLEKLARDGLEKRFSVMNLKPEGNDESKKKREEYLARLEMELKVIEYQGFEGYFLIVWDFINYAKQNNIPVGPGRGSAAGSLTAYSLGISDIDPIRYGLLFERFLNPERKSMPDIDVDFCEARREEVISYVRKKYGSENVGQIITFGTMKAKAVIRDIGRVKGMSYGDVDAIAKLIPNELGITLSRAIEKEPRLKVLIDEREEVKDLFNVAMTLEGLSRQMSTHAAGVVISPEPLANFTPLARNIDQKQGEGNNGEVLTQYDMKDIESIGLLKMDFLGLKTLTVLDKAVKLIKKTRGITLQLDTIPLDDPEVYSFLWEGKTAGIFQLESSGMRDVLRKIKPTVFEDIVALIAIYRPGPLESGMVDDFIAVKHGRKEAKYEHPLLAEILKETYGVILYQEQAMKIANVLSGFSLAEADILRKAMGKKNQELMATQAKKFVDGAAERKVDKKVAQRIFDLIEKFSGYGFNKSHSAAYAVLTYRTSYLKHHYPQEFMASLMTSDINNTDKLVKYINECREMGMNILPPDINHSMGEFTIENGSIRYGLTGVKNVGMQAIDSVVAARESGAGFRDIFDLCERVDLRVMNKRVVESLIQCGAFDCFKMPRSAMMAGLDGVLEEAQKAKEELAAGQISLFGGEGTISEGIFKKLPNMPEWEEHELLTREKELLGFYLTSHPLARYEELLKRYADFDLSAFSGLDEKEEDTAAVEAEVLNNAGGASHHVQNSNMQDGKVVHVGGCLKNVKSIKNRKGDDMAFLELEDLNGKVEVTVFADAFREASTLLQKDRLVFLKGRLQDRNGVFGIIAEKIIPIERVREEFTEKISIEINSAGLRKEDVKALKDILSHQGSGGCRVLFTVHTREGLVVNLKLDDKARVKLTDKLIADVEKIFGNGSVSCLL